jgi:hypothetical protein
MFCSVIGSIGSLKRERAITTAPHAPDASPGWPGSTAIRLPVTWNPRRRSLSEDRAPAADSNVTGWVLPHCFVHHVQRALSIVCFADHRVAAL